MRGMGRNADPVVAPDRTGPARARPAESEAIAVAVAMTRHGRAEPPNHPFTRVATKSGEWTMAESVVVVHRRQDARDVDEAHEEKRTIEPRGKKATHAGKAALGFSLRIKPDRRCGPPAFAGSERRRLK